MTHLVEVTEEAQAALQPACPSARREVVQLDLGEVIEGRTGAGPTLGRRERVRKTRFGQ